MYFQFEENEKKRMKAEQQRQESKHKKQWDDLVFRNETALKELEQLQVHATTASRSCYIGLSLKIRVKTGLQ